MQLENTMTYIMEPTANVQVLTILLATRNQALGEVLAVY